MKKEVIHFVQYVLVKILFFGAAYPLQAQVSNPSSWESFVDSDENRLVSDTLRLQTFGDSEWDNWGYTLTVNSSLVQDKHTIKIPVGSGIIFHPFSLNNYTNVKIVSHIAGLKLEPGELLLFNVHRNNSDEVITGNTPEQGKDYMGYRYLTIGSNPSSFAITTNKKVNTQNGYYMTDSVFAYGDIPSYSLFSGIGKLERHNPLVASSSTPPQECAHKRECKYNNRYVLQRYRHSFRITGDQSWQPVYPTEFGPIRKQSLSPFRRDNTSFRPYHLP